jgi:hypothetical protein
MIGGQPVCITGTGQVGASSSLSMMARSVWGAPKAAVKGKVVCGWLVGSHIWIGSLSTSESCRGVRGGGRGCWGFLFAKEDMAQ